MSAKCSTWPRHSPSWSWQGCSFSQLPAGRCNRIGEGLCILKHDSTLHSTCTSRPGRPAGRLQTEPTFLLCIRSRVCCTCAAAQSPPDAMHCLSQFHLQSSQEFITCCDTQHPLRPKADVTLGCQSGPILVCSPHKLLHAAGVASRSNSEVPVTRHLRICPAFRSGMPSVAA